MLVDLTQESADLHMGLALVLEHLQFQGGLRWVVKVSLNVLTIYHS